MKLHTIKSLLPVAALAMTLSTTSCIGDLDVDPTIDKSTSMVFERDLTFAKLYANMALTGQRGPAGEGDIDGIDEGTSDFYRQIWNMNELPTDEAICSWADPGIPEYNFAKWDASHGMITAMYYRLYFGITLANTFLERTENDTEAKTMRAEARFLRALYYYYAMDFYGNVPFITELSIENAPQGKRADIYAFIEQELTEALPDLSEPRQATYGRADKAAAWMLLARLYLNAEVYTGTAQWNKAADYAQKVMNSGYTLCENYRYLFMGDNNTNGAQNEILLPILQDGIDTQNYGGSLFLIASTHKDDMESTGTSEAWSGNRARPDLVKKFFPNSEVPQANTLDMVAAAHDERALFFGVKRKFNVEEVGVFTDGFSCSKFSNLYAKAGKPRDVKFVDMDVPFMRVAEAYLTFAEAKLRLGDKVSAKNAIDAIRTRAKANTQPEYELNDVCDEWAREFAFEGRRRIDLVRFGKFGGNSDYKWEWKGGVKEGTNFSATKNIYGIPTKDVVANDNLVQNPGY